MPIAKTENQLFDRFLRWRSRNWCEPMNARDRTGFRQRRCWTQPDNGHAALVKAARRGDPCLTPTGRCGVYCNSSANCPPLEGVDLSDSAPTDKYGKTQDFQGI